MLLDKFRNTINKYKLLYHNDRVVIGVSGGPDSIALLHLFKALTREYKLTLHVAHLDHMLRKASSQDAKFVQQTCNTLGIPVTIKSVNINLLAKKGSIEEIARDQRLKFFFHVARKIRADKIALGHNLDDQAETVLMRLLRGSGLYGLSGIMPRRSINGYTIIRPLIEIKRRQIESFLKHRNIKPRIDESNFENTYLRNRLRHHLLPLLEKKYNKNIRMILSNTAHVSADDYDYLNRSAERTAEVLGRKMPLNKINALHPSMRRLVLRLNFQRLKGDTRTLSYRHIQELEDLLFNRPVNSIVDLPSNISVVKKKTYLRFYLR
jgi:tRNA(Ile)-lysidine synthase